MNLSTLAIFNRIKLIWIERSLPTCFLSQISSRSPPLSCGKEFRIAIFVWNISNLVHLILRLNSASAIRWNCNSLDFCITVTRVNIFCNILESTFWIKRRLFVFREEIWVPPRSHLHWNSSVWVTRFDQILDRLRSFSHL